MPGIAREESNSTTNPLIWFGYQEAGKLKDLAGSLAYAVFDETGATAVQRVAKTTLSLTTAKIGTGRYAPTFQPTAVGSWGIGTHRVEWYYRPTNLTEPEKVIWRHFEVLDETRYPSGLGYIGYANSVDLGAVSELATRSVTARQVLLQSASLRAEMLTGRFFEPRFVKLALSVDEENRVLPLSTPIIGLDTISHDDGTGVLTTVATTGIKVFNRHLRGMADPDDRDYPRIEFAANLEDIVPGIESATFLPGVQVYEVSGIFGYTESDGSPLGDTPYELARAVAALVVRESLDPTGSDLASLPSRIRSARTRDQSVTFATGNSFSGMLSGDPFVDQILVQYLRPPQLEAV